jgi:hypothetical protein
MRIKEMVIHVEVDLEEVEDALDVEAVVEEVKALAKSVTGTIMMLPSASIATQDLCKAMAMVTGHLNHNTPLNSPTPMAMEFLELNVHLCLKLC